jgi:hypothetical protein
MGKKEDSQKARINNAHVAYAVSAQWRTQE